MKTFGALLFEHRFTADLAQNELARRASVNVGTINRLERDQRNAPYPSMVREIARVLHLTPGETDRLLRAAGFPATECYRANRRRWHRWAQRGGA